MAPRAPAPSDTPDVSPDDPRGALALLTDRTFGPYFAGNLTSNLGQWFQNLTAAVVVFELTGSSLLVGAVAVMQFGAALVLAPYAGALTDRVDRRLLLFMGQLVATLSASVLAVWVAAVGVDGLSSPWPILVATFGIGLGAAFSIPAAQALVPALVPPVDLGQAIALNSVTFNLARAVGPALAGLTLVTFGPAAAFGVNAVSYLPLLTVLLMIRPRPVRRDADADRSVSAGLRYVRRDPTAALLLAGVAALGFASDPVNTLTPGMAGLLQGPEGLVAWFVAAFGTGAAVTSLGVGRLRRRFPPPTLAAAGLAVLGTGMLGFALAPFPAGGLAALVLAGAGFLLAITALTTMLQQRVPEQLRGRVMALWGAAFLGSRPLAATLDGAVADLVGVRAGVALAALFALAAAVVVHRRLVTPAVSPS